MEPTGWLLTAIAAMATGLVYLVQWMISNNAHEREMERADRDIERKAHALAMTEMNTRHTDAMTNLTTLHTRKIELMTATFKESLHQVTTAFQAEVTACHGERLQKDKLLSDFYLRLLPQPPKEDPKP